MRSRPRKLLRYVFPITLSAVACGGAEMTGNTEDNILTGPQDDADGDGLTNEQEMTARRLLIDTTGFGLGQSSFLEERLVDSDPFNPDTDGDGLLDGEESLVNSDPRDPDTDGDGLSDFEEVKRWRTSPVSVDSDGDSRAAGEVQTPPNAALFDQAELDLVDDPLIKGRKVPGPFATSPLLDDTDGDGVGDLDEWLDPTRSPNVADLPQVDIQMVDGLDVRLHVTYTDGFSREEGYGTTFSSATTQELSRSEAYATTKSAEVSVSVGAEVEAGFPPSASVSTEVTATAGFSTTETAEVTATKAEEVGFAQDTYRSDVATREESSASGSLSIGIRVSNPGGIAYEVSDFGLTVRQLVNGTARTVATLLAKDSYGSFALSAGAETSVIQLSADDVDASLIKAFLKSPSSLMMEPAGYEITNGAGNNFVFETESIFARTAIVVVDYGNGEVGRYRVATNVDSGDDGQLAGVPMAQVMATLGLEYETTAQADGRTVLTSVSDGTGQLFAAEMHEGAAPDLGDGNPSLRRAKRFWTLLAAGHDAPIDTSANFEHIRIHNRDEIRLVYIRDDDRDGIYDREEFLRGTSDARVDSDGDGLSDYAELRGRWLVRGSGVETASVTSSPLVADADRDGLLDADEKAAGSHPELADTDGDGLTDGEEARHGTSPTDDDSDDDGLKDGMEISLGANPLDPDTDGDGKLDGADDNPLAVGEPKMSILHSSAWRGICFIDLIVTDEDSDDFDIRIDWGDGTVITESYAEPLVHLELSHRYPRSGSYTVEFIATDEHGNTSSLTHTCRT